MKIGLTGDTHGSMQNLRRVIAAAPPVEQWLHTGDYARDSLYLKSQTGLEVTAVCGNCDAGETDFNVDEFLYLQGFNIWLAHGHRYLHGGSPQELVWWAHRLEVDIVVFGHTHVPLVKWYGDVLLVNPGSPSRPRSMDGPTFGVLTLNEGEKPSAEIIRLAKP